LTYENRTVRAEILKTDTQLFTTGTRNHEMSQDKYSKLENFKGCRVRCVSCETEANTAATSSWNTVWCRKRRGRKLSARSWQNSRQKADLPVNLTR